MSEMMRAEHGNPNLLDDFVIGITIFGPQGRAELGVIEASNGSCAIQTPAGPAWMAVRLGAGEIELRVFTAPQATVEAVAAYGQAHEVEVASGRRHFLGGFWLSEGVSVTVIDPATPAFNAYGPGAATFLRTRPVDSVWPDLPTGWVSAIRRALGDAIRNSDEGATHVASLH
jgi:hypothetical protein